MARKMTPALRARILAEGLSNEEYFRGLELADFLRWMLAESSPVPETDEESNKLITRYIKHRRLEQFEELLRREK